MTKFKKVGLSLLVFFIAAFLSSSSYALTCKVGDKSKVLWKGHYYQATITGSKGDKCCITYDGWAKKWDECVGSSRIQVTGRKLPFNKGENVEVSWKGKYYKASITGISASRYCITYKGYSRSWDECVVPRRVRK